MQISNNTRISKAWTEFFAAYPANFAVTLAYNPVLSGTVFPAYRVTEAGEYIHLKTRSSGPSPTMRRLATARRIPPEMIQSDLDRLHRDVDRILFGARFNKLHPEQRTGFIGFIEHPDTNAHAHLAWRVPSSRADEFTELIEPLWQKTTQYGTVAVAPIRDDGWGSYCTKLSANSEPELFLHSRT